MAKKTSNQISNSINSYAGYPLLSEDEEKELLTLVSNGNKDARDKLVMSNMRYVIKKAQQYKNVCQTLDLEELIQYGACGLVDAAKRFDLSKDVKFITFATRCIEGKILDAINNEGSTIRLPKEKNNLLQKYKKLEKEFCQENGQNPTLEELCDKYRLPQDKIKEVLRYRDINNLSSYDDILSSHNPSYEGTMPITTHNPCSISNNSDKKDVSDAVQYVLSTLKPIEREVLWLHYFDEYKLTEIATKMNRSSESVRLLVRRAEKKFRETYLKVA